MQIAGPGGEKRQRKFDPWLDLINFIGRVKRRVPLQYSNFIYKFTFIKLIPRRNEDGWMDGASFRSAVADKTSPSSPYTLMIIIAYSISRSLTSARRLIY